MSQEMIAASRRKLARYRGKILPQLLMQSFAIVLTAMGSFMLMTWLVSDILGVENLYIAMGYEMLGALVILILVLVPLNTVIYRRRAREVSTLSDAIRRVANGDFTARIPTRRKDQMTPIYEDFNRMCAELESVQLMRNDFINNYSHEFKTPIASINGFASLLLDRKVSEEDRRKYLEIIVEESARLSKLATNTILLSKLSNQQIVADTEVYDLSEQIRQCSIILSKQWMEKAIKFDGNLPETMFRGNRELMQHLWLNLLINAIDHTPPGGRIAVDVAPRGDSVEIVVSDTGEGMDEVTLSHLFDPYFQGDTSHSRKGLGLGLSIAHRIVELCRGTIAATSAPGHGARFEITLPAGLEGGDASAERRHPHMGVNAR